MQVSYFPVAAADPQDDDLRCLMHGKWLCPMCLELDADQDSTLDQDEEVAA